MSIHTLVEKIKGYKAILIKRAGERRQMLIYIGILAGASIISFYLGFIARAESVQASPVVINCPLNAYMNPSAATGLSALPNTANAFSSVSSKAPAAAAGAYVASKNGKNYYPIGCTGASRIKDENKVFFNNQASAQAAGFTLASGCN